MTTERKLERALALLAEATTVVRDLYCGYPPRECGTHPADCVTQNRVVFDAIDELGDEMRETWTIEYPFGRAPPRQAARHLRQILNTVTKSWTHMLSPSHRMAQPGACGLKLCRCMNLAGWTFTVPARSSSNL